MFQKVVQSASEPSMTSSGFADLLGAPVGVNPLAVHIAPGVAAGERAIEVGVEAGLFAGVGRLDLDAVEDLVPGAALALHHGGEIPPEGLDHLLLEVRARVGHADERDAGAHQDLFARLRLELHKRAAVALDLQGRHIGLDLVPLPAAQAVEGAAELRHEVEVVALIAIVATSGTSVWMVPSSSVGLVWRTCGVEDVHLVFGGKIEIEDHPRLIAGAGKCIAGGWRAGWR